MSAVAPILRIVIEAAAEHYLDWLDVSELYDHPEGRRVVQFTGTFVAYKLTVSYSRSYTGEPAQDAAMTTHHFVQLGGDGNPAGMSPESAAAVEEAFDAFWEDIRGGYSPSYAVSQYQWREDGPDYKPFGTNLSPTIRTIGRNLQGTVGSQIDLPPQIAISVTEVTGAKFTVANVEGAGTQQRNRWGRFYLPAGIAGNSLHGRIAAGWAEGIATAVQTFYNTCVASSAIPVMYSPTTGNAWSVTDIHVDDIYDVIRSRRFTTPLSRHSKSIDAAA